MYGKIFTSIYDSTLMSSHGWLGVYVFSSMIVMANREGIVSLDEKSLYKRLGLDEDKEACSFERFLQVLEALEGEDSLSNITAMNGKRILRLSQIEEFDDNRGWLIVNYEYYRKRGSKEERNEYKRGYMAAIRKLSNKPLENNDVNKRETVCNSVTNVKHTDTDIDTDIDKKKALMSSSSSKKLDGSKPKNNYSKQANEILKFLNEKTGRRYPAVKSNINLIIARLKEFNVQDIKSVIAKKCREWGPDEKMNKYLRPMTLFRASNFAQYQGELINVEDD